MKKIKNLIIYLPLVLLAIALISCDDDDETAQEVDVFLGCCSDEPVFVANVDNLDQSVNGEISVSDILTPNGDGQNDYFGVINIQNYDNHMVTIYDSNDEIIFESTDYGADISEFFPWQQATGSFEAVDGIPDGTYKYKIVIENEETFVKSGNFCFFTNDPPVEQQNFSECLDEGEFDPILTGF